MEGKNAYRYAAEMVALEGISQAEAIKRMQDRFEAGDEEIGKLPQIQQFAQQHFKSTLENTFTRGMIDLLKVPTYLGSFASSSMGDAYQKLKDEQDLLPNNFIAEQAGPLVADAAIYPITGPIGEAIKVPAISRTFGRFLGGQRAREVIDTAMDITQMGLKDFRAVERARFGYTALESGLRLGIGEKLQGEDTGHVIGAMVTAGGLGLAGLAGKKVAQLMGYDGIRRAVDFAARKHGVSANEILATFDNTFKLKAELVQGFAPEDLIKDVDFVIQEEGLKESAKFVEPPAFGPEKTIDMPPQYPPPPSSFAGLERNQLPARAPEEVFVTGFEHPNYKGGNVIVTAISRFLGSKVGNIRSIKHVVTRVKKPLVVDYNAEIESGAEAALGQLYRNPKHLAIVRRVLNMGFMPKENTLYRDVVHELTSRKAVERGYGSIIMRGKSGFDDLVVDLKGFRGKKIGNIEQVMENIHNRIREEMGVEVGPHGLQEGYYKVSKKVGGRLGVEHDEVLQSTYEARSRDASRKFEEFHKGNTRYQRALNMAVPGEGVEGKRMRLINALPDIGPDASPTLQVWKNMQMGDIMRGTAKGEVEVAAEPIKDLESLLNRAQLRQATALNLLESKNIVAKEWAAGQIAKLSPGLRVMDRVTKVQEILKKAKDELDILDNWAPLGETEAARNNRHTNAFDNLEQLQRTANLEDASPLRGATRLESSSTSAEFPSSVTNPRPVPDFIQAERARARFGDMTSLTIDQWEREIARGTAQPIGTIHPETGDFKWGAHPYHGIHGEEMDELGFGGYAGLNQGVVRVRTHRGQVALDTGKITEGNKQGMLRFIEDFWRDGYTMVWMGPTETGVALNKLDALNIIRNLSIAAGAGGIFITIDPSDANAAMMSTGLVREFAAEVGAKSAKELVDTLNAPRATGSYLGNGIQMALRHVYHYMSKIPGFQNTIRNVLPDVGSMQVEDFLGLVDHVLTRAKLPGEPVVRIHSVKLPSIGAMPGGGLDFDHVINIYHPAVPEMPVIEGILSTGTNSKSGYIQNLTGIGPGTLGQKFLKSSLKEIAKQIPYLEEINPGMRVTGTAEKYKIQRAGGLIKLGVIPLAIAGTAIAITPEESDAGVISQATRATVNAVAKRMAGQGLKDLGESAVNSFSERLAMAMDTDPGSILGPMFKNTSAWTGKERNWGASHVRIMPDGSDHPYWITDFVTPFLNTKEKYQLRMMRDFREGARKIVAETGLKKENFEHILKHLEGLEIDEAGGYKQTSKYFDKDTRFNIEYNNIAKRIRKEIIDPIFTEVKGVDPVYTAIFKRFGLEDKPGEFTVLRGMQIAEEAAIDPFNIQYPDWIKDHIAGKVTAYEGAARNLKGKLLFDDSHDLTVKPFEGHFTFQPIPGEKGVIQDKIREIYKTWGDGPNNDILPKDQQDTVDFLKVRLADLDAMEVRMKGPRILGAIPKHKYYGPLTVGKQIGMLVDDDPRTALDRYIGGALSKRRFDVSYRDFRLFKKGANEQGLNDLTDLATTWLESTSGKRIREDQALLTLASSVTKLTHGRAATLGEVREVVNNVLQFQFYMKLGMLPIRFPLMNASQTLLTTQVIGGMENTLAGMRQAFTKEGWAYAAQHIDILSSELGSSEISLDVGRFSNNRIFNWVNQIVGKPEDLNRVVAFHTGRAQFLEAIAKGKKLSRVVKTYIPQKGLTLDEQADEYAKAFVRATQFIRGAEGRPLETVGSGIRTLAGQFKSFPAGYYTLVKDVLRLARPGALGGPGDREAQKMAARMVVSWFTLGGLPAVTGAAGLVGIPLYDMVNRFLVREGIGTLPDKTGIGYVGDMIGNSFPLDNYPALKDLGKFINSVDISGGLNPFNMPQARMADSLDMSSEAREQYIYDLTRFLAGPTYSMVGELGFDIGQELAQIGEPAQRTVRDLSSPKLIPGLKSERLTWNLAARKARSPLRAVSPFGISMLDALQEYAEGGVYTQSGDIMARRSGAQMLARALNLQPSVSSQHYRVMKDLEFAMSENRPELIQPIMRAAREQGIVLTSKAMNQLRSQVTKIKRGRARGRK